ncbi:MAG: hypothetical protein JRH20_18380 [Deltaproteobacteria bacterium]|nr:hypothetical protein [Deltaproteobacteria bacterium]
MRTYMLLAVTLAGGLVFGCESSERVVDDAKVGDLADGAALVPDTVTRDDTTHVDTNTTRECVHPTDCALRPASCCGECGAYTRDDIVSLPHARLHDYASTHCPADAACPPCYRDPPPDLLADCTSAGACSYVDLYDPGEGHRSEYTSCDNDSNCVLRVTDCCECGASLSLMNLVAIRQDKRADFERLLCEPGTGCPECVLDYAPYFTWCGADASGLPKRCRVDMVGP